jgi:hypothetical protein
VLLRKRKLYHGKLMTELLAYEDYSAGHARSVEHELTVAKALGIVVGGSPLRCRQLF